MSPTLNDGDSVLFKKIRGNTVIKKGDIVVFNHPFKHSFKIVKRVVKVKSKSKLFVEGDNYDPLSTDDSNNFGYIDRNLLIAFKR
tara:strand:+ start:169 stop:423 length:255 start_codon:yes stop_codon:yes gene_type:complete